MSSSSQSDVSRRDRKRQQTADTIVATAFDLFARHGYDGVSMEQIAAAADVAKGTLYNYFPVKEAILRHRFHAEMASQLPTLMAGLPAGMGCADRLRGFLHAVAGHSESNRPYLGPYIAYRLSQPDVTTGRETRSGIATVFAHILADGQDRGEIDPALDTVWLAETLQFMHLATVLRWLAADGGNLTADFDAMLQLFLHGCAGGRP